MFNIHVKLLDFQGGSPLSLLTMGDILKTPICYIFSSFRSINNTKMLIKPFELIMYQAITAVKQLILLLEIARKSKEIRRRDRKSGDFVSAPQGVRGDSARGRWGAKSMCNIYIQLLIPVSWHFSVCFVWRQTVRSLPTSSFFSLLWSHAVKFRTPKKRKQTNQNFFACAT